MNCPKCNAEFLRESFEYNYEGKFWLCQSRLAYIYLAGLKDREVFVQSDKCRIKELENAIAKHYVKRQSRCGTQCNWYLEDDIELYNLLEKD